jgi:hypothetical protein
MSYKWRDTETATKEELLSDIAYAEICFHTHHDYVGDAEIVKRYTIARVSGEMDRGKEQWHIRVDSKLEDKYKLGNPMVDWTEPYVKQSMEVIKLLHEVLTKEYDCTEYSFELPDWIDRLFGVK